MQHIVAVAKYVVSQREQPEYPNEANKLWNLRSFADLRHLRSKKLRLSGDFAPAMYTILFHDHDDGNDGESPAKSEQQFKALSDFVNQYKKF